MTDKVQKIREEVERRMNRLYLQLPDASKVEHEDISMEQASTLGKYVALESLFDFINSIPEELVSEDLEEAAKTYSNNIDNIYGSIGEQTRNAFKSGAQWKEKQIIL